jgi:hypothetical protein
LEKGLSKNPTLLIKTNNRDLGLPVKNPQKITIQKKPRNVIGPEKQLIKKNVKRNKKVIKLLSYTLNYIHDINKYI